MLTTIIVFIFICCKAVDLCQPNTIVWNSWGPCSKSCGGGTRQRYGETCVWGTQQTGTGACNEFCYNGGTFIGGICRCPTRRIGTCCESYQPCHDHNGGCADLCKTLNGQSRCACRTGYQLHSDQISCTDIDECAQSTAGCSQICNNTYGEYKCNCKDGYTLNDDGHSCDDIDECAQSTAGCSQICNNTDGDYKCNCKDGYTLSGDGQSCDDIDECVHSTAGCSQICNNTDGEYKCNCKDGYTLNGDGHSCDDIDNCLGITCQHDGTCLENVTSFACLCITGYTGKFCENDISPTNTTFERNGQPHFDMHAANPKLIACEVYTNCEISVAYIGQVLQPPVIGYIDSDLKGEEPKTAFGNLFRHDTNGTSNLASMIVTSPVIGNHALCLHLSENGTSTSTGNVTDQLCLTVMILAAGSINSSVDQALPHFSGVSALDGSSLSCMKGLPCHMWATTVPTETGHCANVEKCPPRIPPLLQGLNILLPILSSGTCITEIDFTMSTDQAKLCLSAGQSGEQRTYDIVATDNSETIVDLAHSSSSVGRPKPYFMETPELKKPFSCERGSTCTTSIYVRSKVPMSSIDITYNRNAPSTIRGPTLLNHTVDYLYTATLNVHLNISGIYHICLVAKDINNLTSDEKCIETEMVYHDPCESLPCQNSGTCVRDLKNPEDYVCVCQSNRYFGKNCEKLQNLCQPNPCMHGTCHVVNSYASCQCDPGYSGDLCERVSFDCHKTRCGHGVCREFIFSSHCACYPGYVGQLCETRSP